MRLGSIPGHSMQIKDVELVRRHRHRQRRAGTFPLAIVLRGLNSKIIYRLYK